MKVLIDECAPRAIKNHLRNYGHEFSPVQESGWAGKQNGELLRLAEGEFDVFVTLDMNLNYQQNLTGRKISIVILHSPSNSLKFLQQLFPELVSELVKVKPSEIALLGGFRRE